MRVYALPLPGRGLTNYAGKRSNHVSNGFETDPLRLTSGDVAKPRALFNPDTVSSSVESEAPLTQPMSDPFNQTASLYNQIQS